MRERDIGFSTIESEIKSGNPLSPDTLFNDDLYGHITDTNGTPIAVDQSQANLVKSNLGGVRKGTVTNQEMLREYGHSRKDVLDFVRQVRAELFPHSEKLTLSELAIVTSTIENLPGYLVLRKHNPSDIKGKIPVVISQASRASLGISGALRGLQRTRDNNNSPITPDEVYEYAEKEKILVTRGGREDNGKPPMSCPAPKATITEFITALIDLQNIESTPNILEDVVHSNEIQNAKEFAVAYTEGSMLKITHSIRLMEVIQRHQEAVKNQDQRAEKEIAIEGILLDIKHDNEKQELAERCNAALGRTHVRKKTYVCKVKKKR